MKKIVMKKIVMKKIVMKKILMKKILIKKILILIEMTTNYYQEHKEKLQKEAHERYQNLSKKKKQKA